jgi:hypothetical protein
MIPMEGRIHGVEDILLGFGPKDAGSIPAGSVSLPGCGMDSPTWKKVFSGSGGHSHFVS